MRPRARRGGLVGVVLAATLFSSAAPVAGAAEELPTGRANGIAIGWKDGTMTVVFGKSAKPLYRKIAGRRVTVSCWHIADGGTGDGGGVTFRAPRQGRTLHTGDSVRDWDYCSIWRAASRSRRGRATFHHPRQFLAAIPLSQKGAVFLDEHLKATTMSALFIFAQRDDEQEWGPFKEPARFVADVEARGLPSRVGPGRLRVVALAGADETPPPGAIGYYSDGADRAAMVTLAATGRRLFVELDRDKVLRTNVIEHLVRELE